MIRYIFGKPGTGKTTFCLNEIIKAQSEETGERLIYIVPEQFSLESENILLDASHDKGLMSAQVLSFNRLAYYIFKEQGGVGTKILEDFGTGMLLRKVLLKCQKELKYYKAACKTQGFIDNMCNLLSEFYKYGVCPDTLLKISNNNNLQESLKQRINDIYTIYKNFKEHMNDNYISGEETLDVLAEKIAESDFLDNTSVWVDGFKDFTFQEIKVIKFLMQKCKDISFAFTIDSEPANFFDKLSYHDPFFEVKNTVNKLSKIAEENGIFLGSHVHLKVPKRYENFAAGEFISQNFFKQSTSSLSENITVNEHDNIYVESENTAKNIIGLVRDAEYKFSEIGIITPKTELYAKPLKIAFARYKIPLFIDEKKEILSHPLPELCLASLKLISSGFAYENVFRALKTGLLPISSEETDKLENYVLAYGIKGYSWHKEWVYGFSNEWEKKYLNRCREKVLNIFSLLTDSIAKNKKYTVLNLSKAIYRFLCDLEIKGKIADWIKNTELEVSLLHSRIWEIVMDIFDKAVEIFEDMQFTAAEFSKVLESGFAAMSAGIAPPSIDHVSAGALRRSRIGNVRALFVLGINEGLMPEYMKEEGILSNQDREAIKTAGVELAKTLISRAYEEQLLIYEALSKPSERLYLSYHTGDIEGKTALPSQIIDKILKLFPGIKVAEQEKPFESLDSITSADAVFQSFVKSLRLFSNEMDLPDIYKDTYSFFKTSSEFSQKLQAAEKILQDNRIERLSESDIKTLYGDKEHTLKLGITASRLESYVNCPFAYFSKFNLKIAERKLYEIESVDIGNIFHSALEKFTNIIQNENLSIFTLNDEKIYQLADKCVEMAAEEGSNDILQNSGRYKHFKERIKSISGKSIWALTEHLKAGDFTIAKTETDFRGDNAISFDLDNDCIMTLSGRVDRVDNLEKNGTEYLKIIDYKSGAKKFSFAEVFFGLNLQLIIYMSAVLKKISSEKNDGKVYPGAIFYFNLLNPIINYVSAISDSEALKGEFLKAFKMSGVVLRDLDLIKNIDKNIKTNSLIMPVALRDKGSELAATSVTLTREGFDSLMNFAIEKAKEAGREILSGNISASPLKHKNNTSCQYCSFKPLCQYDFRIDQEKLRQVPPLKEKEAKSRITGEENVDCHNFN